MVGRRIYKICTKQLNFIIVFSNELQQIWNLWMFASFSHYIHFFIHFRMTFDSWLYTILEEKKLSFMFSQHFLLSLYLILPFHSRQRFHSRTGRPGTLCPLLDDLRMRKWNTPLLSSQSGGELTAVLRFSASACLLLMISWLISTCWSSSLLNLSGGCFRIRLASPSSPGTVNARDFSRTFPELEEEEEVLDWELSERLSSVVESFPLTVPGKSLWLRVSATSMRFYW